MSPENVTDGGIWFSPPGGHFTCVGFIVDDVWYLYGSESGWRGYFA